MRRSTPRRQLPPELAPDAARGYVLKKDNFREQPLPTHQVACDPAMVEMFATIGIGQWFRYVVGALEIVAPSGC